MFHNLAKIPTDLNILHVNLIIRSAKLNFSSIVMLKYFTDLLTEIGLLLKSISVVGIGSVILGGNKIITLKILKGLFEGEPDCVNQNFVRFSLFLIPTHFENLIHLTVMLQKFKILEDLFERNPPLWHRRFQAGPCPS